ncbi:464_t:CDS:2, partial [Racocetra fulgida]
LCVIPLGTGLTMKSALDHTGSHIMKEGRARFSTSFIEEWLSSTYDMATIFERFKKRYTDPNHNESIMVRIIQRTNSEFVRKGVGNTLLKNGSGDIDMISLLERIVLKTLYTGSKITLVQKSTLELFECGVALLERDDKSGEFQNLEIDDPSFDNTVEDWVAIIDANKCNLIFDEHIKILKDLKNPKRKVMDNNSVE